MQEQLIQSPEKSVEIQKARITELVTNRDIVRQTTLALLSKETDSWQIAKERVPELAEVRINQLPYQSYIDPNSENPLINAAAFVKLRGQDALSQLMQETTRAASAGVRIPSTVEMLRGYETFLTAELAEQCLADPELYNHFLTEKLKTEKSKNGGFILAPLYSQLEDEGIEWTQQKGRKIARFFLHGEPGSGKTEFIKRFNRDVCKVETVEVTGYPFLGFEQLVGSQKIFTDKGINYSAIVRLLGESSAEQSVRIMIQAAHSYAEKHLPTGSSTDREKMRADYFRQYLGLSNDEDKKNDLAADLAKASLNDVMDANHQLNIYNRLHEIKNTAVTHLGALSLQDLSPEAQVAQYLEGIIFTANRLGKNVLIDEADKMMTQASGKSFGGLENLLTKKPGETISVGNISQTLRSDFAIDIIANDATVIPEQIHSRMDLNRRVSPDGLDVLTIMAASLMDEQGIIKIPKDEQAKLAYFLLNEWPRLKALSSSDRTWDLRDLQRLINSMQNTTAPLDVHLRKVTAKFKGSYQLPQSFQPSVDISILFDEITPQISVDTGEVSTLIDAIRTTPSNHYREHPYAYTVKNSGLKLTRNPLASVVGVYITANEQTGTSVFASGSRTSEIAARQLPFTGIKGELGEIKVVATTPEGRFIMIEDNDGLKTYDTFEALDNSPLSPLGNTLKGHYEYARFMQSDDSFAIITIQDNKLQILRPSYLEQKGQQRLQWQVVNEFNIVSERPVEVKESLDGQHLCIVSKTDEIVSTNLYSTQRLAEGHQQTITNPPLPGEWSVESFDGLTIVFSAQHQRALLFN